MYETLGMVCKHCKCIQCAVDDVKVFQSGSNASEELETA
jgi:hypothetical protein